MVNESNKIEGGQNKHKKLEKVTETIDKAKLKIINSVLKPKTGHKTEPNSEPQAEPNSEPQAELNSEPKPHKKSDIDEKLKKLVDFIDMDFNNLYKYLKINRDYLTNIHPNTPIKSQVIETIEGTTTIKDDEVKNENSNNDDNEIVTQMDKEIENKKIHILNILFFIILFINFYYFYFYLNDNIVKKRQFMFNKKEVIDETGKYYTQYINNFMIQSYILYNIYLITLIIIAFYYNPYVLVQFFFNGSVNTTSIFNRILNGVYSILFQSVFTRFLIQNILIIITMSFININLGKTYLDTYNTTEITNYENLTYDDYISISSHYSYIYYLTLLIILGFFSIHLLNIPNLYNNNPLEYYIPYIFMTIYILFKILLNYHIGTLLSILIIIGIIISHSSYILGKKNNKDWKPFLTNIINLILSSKFFMFILILITIIVSLITIKNEKITDEKFTSSMQKKINAYKNEFLNYNFSTFFYSLFNNILSTNFILSFFSFNINKQLSFFI